MTGLLVLSDSDNVRLTDLLSRWTTNSDGASNVVAAARAKLIGAVTLFRGVCTTETVTDQINDPEPLELPGADIDGVDQPDGNTDPIPLPGFDIDGADSADGDAFGD